MGADHLVTVEDPLIVLTPPTLARGSRFPHADMKNLDENLDDAHVAVETLCLSRT